MAVACGRGGIRHTSPLIFFTLFVLIGSSKAQDIGGDTFRSLLAVNSSNSAELERAKALIIGGSPTSPKRFPYMVGVFLPVWNGAGCGGVLLTNRVVLTAAHCIEDSNPADYVILQGFKAYYSSWGQVGQGAAWKRQAVQIITHPGFKANPWSCLGASTARHDLALILLDKPVNTPTVRLPPANAAKPTAGYLVSIGYGQNSPESASGAYSVSASLQRLRVPVVPPQVCSQQLGCDYANPASVTRSIGMVCAGGQAANSAACRGDSGSPLLRPNPSKPNNFKFDVLMGIFSFLSTPCGRVDGAGGYTWVPFYRPWIDKQVAAWNAAVAEINRTPQ